MDFYYDLYQASKERTNKLSYMMGYLASMAATLTKRTYDDIIEEAEKAYEENK